MRGMNVAGIINMLQYKRGIDKLYVTLKMEIEKHNFAFATAFPKHRLAEWSVLECV